MVVAPPPRRIRIKMCGTTRLEDALAAASLGVDALGFIFYGKSPRFVEAVAAETIIESLPPFLDRVGVFVDESIKDVLEKQLIGLSYLQLHGKETPGYCRELKEKLPHCGIIKAFRVGPDTSPAEFSSYNEVVDAFLLDTYVQGEPGGTGKCFDWTLIEKLQLNRPIILAGGLNVENIQAAVATARPYAVDINSGVESAPGIKDHTLLAEAIGKLLHC
jgi:phosphoribosylanthranilate isomerase